MTHALPDFAIDHHACFVFARLSLVTAIDQSAANGQLHRVAISSHHLVVPAITTFPKDAAYMIAQGTADWPAQRMAVIGSSLGGFYATWLAAQRHCKAVLLNPAVDPARDLAKYIGEQSSWHNPAELFYFAPEFVDELRALQVGPLPNPERIWALIAKGDEVLDWREMTARYPGSHQLVLEGGDHALGNFESYLPQVLEFLNLQPST